MIQEWCYSFHEVITSLLKNVEGPIPIMFRIPFLSLSEKLMKSASPVDPHPVRDWVYGSRWSQDNEHKVAGQPSTNVIVFTLQIGYNSPQLDWFVGKQASWIWWPLVRRFSPWVPCFMQTDVFAQDKFHVMAIRSKYDIENFWLNFWGTIESFL